MDKNQRFQIGDLVIIRDRDHSLYGQIFEVVGPDENSTLRLKFLKDENSKENITLWENRYSKNYVKLFPERLSLYRTQEINFIE